MQRNSSNINMYVYMYKMTCIQTSYEWDSRSASPDLLLPFFLSDRGADNTKFPVHVHTNDALAQRLGACAYCSPSAEGPTAAEVTG